LVSLARQNSLINPILKTDQLFINKINYEASYLLI